MVLDKAINGINQEIARLKVGLKKGNEKRDIEDELDMQGQVVGDINQLETNWKKNYDIKKELKRKSQVAVAGFLKKIIQENYAKIKSVDLKFDIPTLKKDMEKKTSAVLKKSFR